MKSGVVIFPTDYAIRADELANATEQRGFESTFFPEHTHIPTSSRAICARVLGTGLVIAVESKPDRQKLAEKLWRRCQGRSDEKAIGSQILQLTGGVGG